MVVQVACGGPVACEVDTRSVHVEPGSPVGMIPAHTLGTCMYVASLLYHNWIQLRLQPTRKLVSSLHTALLFLPHFPTLCFYTLPCTYTLICAFILPLHMLSLFPPALPPPTPPSLYSPPSFPPLQGLETRGDCREQCRLR